MQLKSLTISLSLALTLLVSGCATHSRRNPTYTAPSVAGVSIPLEKTKSSIEKAVISLDSKQDYQMVKRHLLDAREQAATTEVALQEHQALVEKQAQQLNVAVDEKNKAEERAETKAKEAHQNAKERDVLVYVWSVFFALWLLATLGSIVEALPPQYRIAGKVVFLLIGFGIGYGLGRYILRWLAYLFP